MIAFIEAYRAGLFQRGAIWNNVIAGLIVGIVALLGITLWIGAKA